MNVVLKVLIALLIVASGLVGFRIYALTQLPIYAYILERTNSRILALDAAMIYVNKDRVTGTGYDLLPLLVTSDSDSVLLPPIPYDASGDNNELQQNITPDSLGFELSIPILISTLVFTLGGYLVFVNRKTARTKARITAAVAARHDKLLSIGTLDIRRNFSDRDPELVEYLDVISELVGISQNGVQPSSVKQLKELDINLMKAIERVYTFSEQVIRKRGQPTEEDLNISKALMLDVINIKIGRRVDRERSVMDRLLGFGGQTVGPRRVRASVEKRTTPISEDTPDPRLPTDIDPEVNPERN